MKSTHSISIQTRFWAAILLILVVAGIFLAFMYGLSDLLSWLFLNENSQARLYKL